MTSEKTTTLKTSFKDNLKKHKKKIITATVIVGASTVAVVLGIKFLNSKATKELLENATKTLSDNKLPVDNLVADKTVDISVPSYVRNLPMGQKASAEKIRQACDFGISLKEGQTLVDQYSYTRKCA